MANNYVSRLHANGIWIEKAPSSGEISVSYYYRKKKPLDLSYQEAVSKLNNNEIVDSSVISMANIVFLVDRNGQHYAVEAISKDGKIYPS